MKGNNRKRKTRRLLSVVTAAALCLTSVSIPFGTKESKAESTTEKSASELSNPTTDSEGVTTWDCIYFGNYWQNDTNGNGTADQSDDKEPIKWRVLSVDGDDAFLLADQNLDWQPYNEELEAVTWETCTLRTWLNGTFLSNAFSSTEQAAIQSTTVVNDDNSEYGTEGGNSTTDQVYLLSIAEVSNTAYGFNGKFDTSSETRVSINTAYAKEMNTAGNSVWWWLRSPGRSSSDATSVNDYGVGFNMGYGASYSSNAIRPALHLNLSSSTLWSYAGKVTSDGDSGTSQTTSPTPTKEPSAEPEKTGTPTQAPTKTPTPTSTHIPSTSELSNPTTDSEGVTTWDCVYFGNYWQNDTNGDGTADQNDTKEPIKWRVLSVDGDDAFLLADQNLDCQPYNEEDEDVTWETCTLRTWLNGTFLSNAFSSAEQAAIQSTTVVNDDNPEYGTEGGNNTTDKVYLLSIAEASNTAYGFHGTFLASSKTREAKNTAYAEACGAYTETETEYEGNGYWWLRLPGYDSYYVAYVDYDGWGNYRGRYVSCSEYAVRPALHVNLSSSTLWSYAGKVTAEGGNITATQMPTPTSTYIPSTSGLENPTTDSEGVTTWDCIYFGNYWQNDTNGDGTADQSDDKEPIKWRVLSVDGDDVFLLADQNLDCQSYNEEDEDVTWETCTLRTWLNNTFLSNAFNSVEQAALQSTPVVNGNNMEYGTEGGNSTTDQVYLLSIAEVGNTAYGFSGTFSANSETREAKNTAYAKVCGASTATSTKYEGNGSWWLRSPGHNSDDATDVSYRGDGDDYGVSVCYSEGVRPALHVNLSRLNLSSSILWSYAGKVTADGGGASQTPTSTHIPSTSGLENPSIDSDGVATWDCVWFGNYWQNDTNSDGTADQNDTKEPIKWRVLSVDGDDAFLLADQNLDCQIYTDRAANWEKCTIRTWLNTTFLVNAFSTAEQAAIKAQTVLNDGSPFSAEDEYNTTDQVYLLSTVEASNAAYGFWESDEASATGEAKNTAYAASYDGMSAAGETDGWWLRSRSAESMSAFLTGGIWSIGLAGNWGFLGTLCGVRPVLHLDLSSSVWSPAGTVRSDGTEASIPPTGAAVPTLTPSLAPTASAPAPSVAPTGQSQASVTPTVTPVSTLAPTITPPATADTTSTDTPSVPSVQLKSLKALKKGKAKAEWKKVTKIDGYRLQYAQDKKFKKKAKTKWLAAKKKSVTLTGLKKKKTYYVRIAAYVLSDGKKVYGKWSNIKKVKIKK